MAQDLTSNHFLLTNFFIACFDGDLFSLNMFFVRTSNPRLMNFVWFCLTFSPSLFYIIYFYSFSSKKFRKNGLLD